MSISFSTPPEDDSGKSHILEHMVLRKSGKYQSENLISRISEEALVNYAQAFTVYDKAVFPFSSSNDKEFINVMDVYLDSVFNPAFYNEPDLFSKEVWRYIYDTENDELKVNGVVLNEMLGYKTNPEQNLSILATSSLFPDNNLRYNFAGIPEEIIKLSNQDIIDFHTKHFHPSNCCIVIYGNGKIEKHLEFISNNYLSKYSYKKPIYLKEQLPRFDKPYFEKSSYNIDEFDDREKRSYYSVNFLIKKSDYITLTGFNILKILLNDLPGSPLKKIFREHFPDSDIKAEIDIYSIQGYINFSIFGLDEDQHSKVYNAIISIMSDVTKNGFDTELIKSAIHMYEFQLRENQHNFFPKGTIYTLKIVNQVFSNKSPFEVLQYEKALIAIKNSISSHYFENLIKQNLLEKPHASVVSSEPEYGLTQKENTTLKVYLEQIKNSFDKSKLIKLSADNTSFNVNSAEPIAKLYDITIDDIVYSNNWNSNKREVDNINFYISEHATNKIVYIDFSFDISDFSEEEIQRAVLLAEYVGNPESGVEVNEDIVNSLKKCTGSFECVVDAFQDIENKEVKIIFNVRTKFLLGDTDNALKAIYRVFKEYRIINPNKLLDPIHDIEMQLMRNFLSNTHFSAMIRAGSYISQYYNQRETVSNISLYKKMENFSREIYDGLNLGKYSDLTEKIFSKNRLTTIITTDYGTCDILIDKIVKILNKLSDDKKNRDNLFLKNEFKNEAFIIPSHVQNFAYSLPLGLKDIEGTGALLIFNKIIRTIMFDYSRREGGGYGAFSTINEFGDFFIISYRDPDFNRTLNKISELKKVYLQCGYNNDFLQLQKLNILGRLNQSLSSELFHRRNTMRVHGGYSSEHHSELIKSVKMADIAAVSRIMDKFDSHFEKGFICVFGDEKAFLGKANMFQSVERLIKR